MRLQAHSNQLQSTGMLSRIPHRTMSARRPARSANHQPAPHPATARGSGAWQRGSRSARRHAAPAAAAVDLIHTPAEAPALEQPPVGKEEQALAASLHRTNLHRSDLVASLDSSSAACNDRVRLLEHQRLMLEGLAMLQPYQDALQGGSSGVEAGQSEGDEMVAEWQAVAHQRPAGFDREAQLTLPGMADAAVVTRGGRYMDFWKGVSQDDFALAFPAPDAMLLAVCDGHGRRGELASRAAAEGLLAALPALLASGSSSASSGSPDTQHAVVAAFRDVAAGMQQEKNENGELAFSECGAAVVACLVERDSITAVWSGDCRAVLALSVATPGGPRCLVHPLTKDHKPDSPLEHARIAASDSGRVRQHRLTDAASFTGPALALSRAFGDTWALPLGLTAEPDAVTLTLPPPVAGSFASAAAACAAGPLDTVVSSSDGDDACSSANAGAAAAGPAPARHVLLLACDGLWDVLSNEEAAAIAMSCPSAEAAAHALSHAARRKWAVKYQGIHMDDVTVAVAFLPC